MTIEDINDLRWVAYDRQQPVSPNGRPDGSGLKEALQSRGRLDILAHALGWQVGASRFYIKSCGSREIRIKFVYALSEEEVYALRAWVYEKNKDYDPVKKDSQEFILKEKGTPLILKTCEEAENVLWGLIKKYDTILGD